MLVLLTAYILQLLNLLLLDVLVAHHATIVLLLVLLWIDAQVALRLRFRLYFWALAIVHFFLGLLLNDGLVDQVLLLFEAFHHFGSLVPRSIWKLIKRVWTLDWLSQYKRIKWAVVLTFLDYSLYFRLALTNVIIYFLVSIQYFNNLVFQLFNPLIMIYNLLLRVLL